MADRILSGEEFVRERLINNDDPFADKFFPGEDPIGHVPADV